MITKIRVELRLGGDELEFVFNEFYEAKDFVEQAMKHFVKNKYQNDYYSDKKLTANTSIEFIEDDEELDELLEEISSDFQIEEQKEEKNELIRTE